MKNEEKDPIYSHDTLEFVTVAVKFCAYLEQPEGRDKKALVSTLLKLLPLLYLKAQLLPRIESNGDFLMDEQVTEQDYEWIRGNLYALLAEDDEYLDVVYEEDNQTDETQWKSLSEHLADIYQPVRNFVAAYQGGIEDCMRDALWAVCDNFELYWGEALVDALRRLHRVNNKTAVCD